MILFSYDTETTGLNTRTDEVIEFGWVLYTTGQRRVLEAGSKLVKTNLPISPEVTAVTGLTKPALDRFGYDSSDALDEVIELMQMADAVVGHNVKRYDWRITESWATRVGKKLPEKLLIDTMSDIPGVVGIKLGHMAAEHGFLPLETHSALADAQSCLKILNNYDIGAVVEYAKTPDVIVIAHHARNENETAKKFKFRWNPPQKIWWKAVKETELDKFVKSVPFDVSLADKSVQLEQLWD